MADIRQAFEYAAKNPNSDFANNLKQLAASGSLDVEAKKNGIDLTPFKPKEVSQQQPKTPGDKFNADVSKAAGFVGVKPLAEGLGQALAQNKNAKLLDSAQTDAMNLQAQLLKTIKENKASGKDTTRLEAALKDVGENIQEIGNNTGEILNPNDLTNKEVVGSAIQTAANFVPGAAKGTSLAAKTAIGAGTGYAFDLGSKLQNENKTVGEAFKPGVATIVGGSLPIAGAALQKLIINPLSRIVKGLASATSGVGTDTIDAIIANPEKSKAVTKELQKAGNAKVLKDEVSSIVNGVSTIKKEASNAFGKGLDELSKTDIDPSVFRKNTQSFLDGNGVFMEKGKTNLGNLEFSDPKNINKATELIKRLNSAELDGKSLRKLADDIENAAYKTATSDERISFNRFVRDMGESLRTAITDSTPKLNEINAKYSKDIQLANAVEDIFGKVQFKSLDEINAISQKLEGLFNQKGLSPEIVNDFFSRIGGNAGDLRASEAVRQISSKVPKGNQLGLNPVEIIQRVTSGVVTPKLIRDISIMTGKTQPVVKKILQDTGSPARKALLNLLSTSNRQN